MIEQYLPLVSQIAGHRAKRSNKDFDDLYQEGCVALIEAFSRLEDRETKPISFLHHRVYWAVFDAAYPNRRNPGRAVEITMEAVPTGVEHEEFERVDDADEVAFLEGRLSAKQADVVRLRSQGLKYHEIGQQLGFSKQRAASIYDESLEALRK